jgi:uncharacterized paraquat-inducible protein A
VEEEDCVCAVCDSEFTVKHFEEDQITFCPFCGETLFKDDEEIDSEDWQDEDDE